MAVHRPRPNTKEDPHRIPPPSHRHAAPSAPWPWVDIEDDVNKSQLDSSQPPIPDPCDHGGCGGKCWKEYPQSRFPNWTLSQVKKSRIHEAINNHGRDNSRPCVIYRVDVDSEGIFKSVDKIVTGLGEAEKEETWDTMIALKRPNNLRVRALFLENLSGPVLQILGARFNIEPFFFSSSLNWIPSRFQEEVKPKEGDHITITLTFIRSISNLNNELEASRMSASSHSGTSDTFMIPDRPIAKEMIDTHNPLSLHTNRRLLVSDLLAIHLIRNNNASTIISYHPGTKNVSATKAKFLQRRIRFAGQSVYWQNIFQISPDPTFVLLTFIWHAMYAWDEALEHLYQHICALETLVLETPEWILTNELHAIRAHHLHYSSLLEDFRKTVEFIRDTSNPALEALSETEQARSKNLMDRECTNILGEIARLERSRNMQNKRVKNVMGLVFSTINIGDSKRIQKMTEAAARDSAGMKQIAYLTMVFLPASFVATVFGMNVKELQPDTLETLPKYIATAVPFTLATVWIIIAFQSRHVFPPDTSFWKRLGWPFLLIRKLFVAKKGKEDQQDHDESDEDEEKHLSINSKNI